MKDTGLSPDEIEIMRSVFRRVLAISGVVLYGSRAKGTHRPGSDIDLALVGLDDPVQAEAVAEELDELPTPYRFDVRPTAASRMVSSASTSRASAFRCIGAIRRTGLRQKSRTARNEKRYRRFGRMETAA